MAGIYGQPLTPNLLLFPQFQAAATPGDSKGLPQRETEDRGGQGTREGGGDKKKKGIQIYGFVCIHTFLPLLTKMIHDTLSLISSLAQLEKIIYSNYS